MNALLSPGDTVAIVSPSIMLKRCNELDISPAVKHLEGLGLKVVFVPSTLKGCHIYSGSDIEKAQDIMAAYQNPEIKALVAAHGGASSLRVLQHLDYEVIKNNPKPLIGFSDISSIQMAIYSQTKAPYISGFLCEYDFRYGTISPMVDNDLKAVLNGQKFSAQSGKAIHLGKTEGTLIGGNLSILSDLNGTPYYPNIKNSILLLEDECEKPYKIGLMLTQLRYNPDFKSVKGIIFGKFSECDDSNTTHGELEDILNDFASLVNIPMIKDFDYGHIRDRHVLTFGVPYRFNADKCSLEQM